MQTQIPPGACPGGDRRLARRLTGRWPEVAGAVWRMSCLNGVYCW